MLARSLAPWMLIVMMLAPNASFGQAGATKEYQIKAAFLFNFTQFIEWPPPAFAHAEAPLIIGVVGTDPFGSILDEIVRGEKVGTHPLLIQRPRQLAEMQACHLLFISNSERARFSEIFAALRGHHVLTVGEGQRFVRQGGMIQFVTLRNRVRFGVNADIIRSENLTVSSRLLKLAERLSAMED